MTSYVGTTRECIKSSEFSIDQLSPEEYKNVLSELPEDSSTPPDAQSLNQNELRREVRTFNKKSFCEC